MKILTNVINMNHVKNVEKEINMKPKKAILAELEACTKLKEKYQDEGEDYLATLYNHMILILEWVLDK